MSLDDIWDAPIVEAPPLAPEQATSGSPPPRRRAALFFSDSEDDDGDNAARPFTSKATSPAPQMATTSNVPPGAPDKAELDAMFGNLDDDDDPFGDVQALDIDKLQKQAEAKVAMRRATQPTSTAPRPIGLSSSPPAKNEEKVKTKRVIAKLNEERLLGPDGFPRLIKEYKSFKPRGKGREAQDLERLMAMYHGWTHKLFPKFQFGDTVDRVEKLCRKRRMLVNLRVWRDEAHGVAPGSRPEDDHTDGSNSGSDNEDGRSKSKAPGTEETTQTGPAITPGSSRPSSPHTRPASAASSVLSVPSSATDIDDFDMDALLREEEELMQQVANDASKGPSYKPAPINFDDDDELWAAAGDLNPDSSPSMSVSTSAKPTAVGEADDDDMWNMVDDIIQAPAPKPAPKENPTPAEEEQPTVGADWDDMYE
ncbi:hypothetical protein M422DRAFT_47539 [Sphaerobolus stellatus SS14]|uniref:Chromosome segregation in meiosis protein n=1 Tax=Sphaerobolus stellatus (strain SS14) TaxID=990650 RepID=A0A0C9VZP6_SPHS4|nr:hypothetical protein M422DRAFT_47539 [Sphaerobolus stellatus SS14]